VVAGWDSDEFAMSWRTRRPPRSVQQVDRNQHRDSPKPVPVTAGAITCPPASAWCTGRGATWTPNRELLRASRTWRCAGQGPAAAGKWELFTRRQGREDRAEFTLAITMGRLGRRARSSCWRAQSNWAATGWPASRPGCAGTPQLGLLEPPAVRRTGRTDRADAVAGPTGCCNSACTRVQGWRSDVAAAAVADRGPVGRSGPGRPGAGISDRDRCQTRPAAPGRAGAPAARRPGAGGDLRVLADAGVAMVLAASAPRATWAAWKNCGPRRSASPAACGPGRTPTCKEGGPWPA